MILDLVFAGTLALAGRQSGAPHDGEPRGTFRWLPSRQDSSILHRRSSARETKKRWVYVHTTGLELRVSAQSDSGCVPTQNKECSISDARRNTSWLPAIAAETLTIPPLDTSRFGDDPQIVRLTLAALIQEMYAGLNIEVTTQRPKGDAEYSMVIVGGRPDVIGMGPGIAGLAPLDCGDANPWDISFVFPEVLSDLEGIARVAVQEASHSFGLEHVTEAAYVMYPQPAHSPRGIGYSCMRIEPSPDATNPDGIKCLHTCVSPAHQNGFAELAGLFGRSDEFPLPEDLEAPTAAFARPAPGTHLALDAANVRVDLRADDDVAAVSAQIRANGGPWIEDPTLPFGFNLTNLNPGVYLLEAKVIDFSGNATIVSQRLDVGNSSAAGEKPVLGAEQIAPYLEDQSGKPTACTDDTICYSGTRCIAGRCLREIESSCSIAPDTVPWPAHAMLFAGLTLIARRRARCRRGSAHCVLARIGRTIKQHERALTHPFRCQWQRAHGCHYRKRCQRPPCPRTRASADEARDAG
jgi:hypothetical protein